MSERLTKYVQSVEDYMATAGHASNTEILSAMRQTYPDISATTIHRITSRLAERGKLGKAPSASNNTLRYDANTHPHDHFLCSDCDMLRDASLTDDIRPLIERAVGDGCRISGNLVISGLCKKCNKES
jgi:Fe2+ or Zn2+ uptake regulation protein